MVSKKTENKCAKCEEKLRKATKRVNAQIKKLEK